MKKVLIIAEAGVNHNGDLNLAKKMIDVAFEAGADIIKFQTAIPELVMSSSAPKAEYQIKNTKITESQLEMSKKIHLPLSDFKELKKYCEEVGIKFLSTAFDHISIDLLIDLGQDIFKIPSGEITNIPYLKKVATLKTKIIISTGMSNLSEIEFALDILIQNGSTLDNIIVLHCNTDYPSPYEDVNLLAMNTIKNAFGVRVGYSDHTPGIAVPIAAVALGAEVIEKHFTLSKKMNGPDHLASLNPVELREMIKAIRNIEIALGSGIKKPTPSEMKNLNIARRSIHLSSDIQEGTILNEEHLIMKRPGNGISPVLINNIIGRKLKKSLHKDHMLTFDDFF